jgi:DNA mismatch repair protein MutL
MEPVIAVLPAHVVDQIAAGEVIERPASVVKELVDNAIDAGGKTITVEVAAGGRALVRVTDDGCGMSGRDAVLAFERHATSKLRVVDDLWGIASMGFRGEALPSIASVARVTLTTRRASDLAATRIVIEGSKLISATEVGAPVGTTVEVADLLYNVPARLKFLKGEATEASHVTEWMAKVALAHPHLHLRLKHRNGASSRTALELPPDRDGFARVQAVLGARIASRMIPIDGEEGGVKVTAYLGAPELAQATARGVQLFVGKRAIRDRGVLHALAMGYGELVPRGRYPVAVVLLDLAPGSVDINVHPQKSEVRFADPSAVAAAIRHVVQAGVAAAQWRADGAATSISMTAIASSAAPALPFDGPATSLAQRYARELRQRASIGSIGGRGSRRNAHAGQGSLGIGNNPAREWANQLHRESDAMRAAESRGLSKYTRSLRAVEGGLAEAPVDPMAALADEYSRLAVAAAVPEPELAAEPPTFADGSGRVAEREGYFSQLRYLGQLDLTYLVCETAGELVLVDQHAAHERVELARLITRQAKHDPAIQKLLFPLTIDATAPQLELVGRMGALLAQVGYEAEAFGKSTIALKAVPAGIRHGDPAQLLRRLLDDWAKDGAPSDEQRLHAMLAEIACHSVVRAGDRLAAGEAEALLASLDGIDPETPAPHGRSLLLRLPLAEIGRRFGR